MAVFVDKSLSVMRGYSWDAEWGVLLDVDVTQNYVHTKIGWDNINPGFMVMTN